MSLRFGVVSGDGIKNLSELPSSQNKEGNTDLEESTFLTLDYTTKLQSPRQYGIRTKTNIA